MCKSMNLAQVWWWRYRQPPGRLCSHSETCFALPSSSSVRCSWRCPLQWLIRATTKNYTPFSTPRIDRSLFVCCWFLLLLLLLFFPVFWFVVRFRSPHQVTNHTTYLLSTDQSQIRHHKCMYSKECKDNNNNKSLNLVLKKDLPINIVFCLKCSTPLRYEMQCKRHFLP